MRHRSSSLVLAAAALAGAALAPTPASAASRSWSDCGRAATTEAAVQAGLPARLDADRRLTQLLDPRRPSTVYTTASQALCADYDGDGDVDRLALLRCCTVSSPSPFAVLRNDGGRFAIAYARLSDPVFRLSPGRRRTLVERTPVYAAGDPNCCPSRLRERRISWTGDRFRSTTRIVRAPR